MAYIPFKGISETATADEVNVFLTSESGRRWRLLKTAATLLDEIDGVDDFKEKLFRNNRNREFIQTFPLDQQIAAINAAAVDLNENGLSELLKRLIGFYNKAKDFIGDDLPEWLVKIATKLDGIDETNEF